MRNWKTAAARLAGVAALILTAGAAHAASDQAFIRKAMQGDNSETRLGTIAAERGSSAGIRDFGRMLAREHAAAKLDAARVARALGVAPTSQMTPEARAEERRLARLSGRDFDREFARYMVEDHRKDIDDFQKQARSGGPQTRRLADRTLPVLRHHLQLARDLSRRT